jgi:hypothetical protein
MKTTKRTKQTKRNRQKQGQTYNKDRQQTKRKEAKHKATIKINKINNNKQKKTKEGQ